MTIFQRIYGIYCIKGLSAAVKAAYKYKPVKEERCDACDNMVPALKHECLICGQHTTRYKDCPQCKKGKLEFVNGTEPYNTDYFICDKCDSTYTEEYLESLKSI